MAEQKGILEVGTALVELLRTHLVPDTIANPDTIGLCSPEEKGDILLGIHLYDIRENEDIRTTEMVNLATTRQRYPSTYLSLSYMITAYSTADMKFRAGEDQRILSRVVQVLAAYGMFSAETLQPVTTISGLDVRTQMMPLSIEEKQRLWNFQKIPYRASLFYRVTPVELISLRKRKISRVVELELRAEEETN